MIHVLVVFFSSKCYVYVSTVLETVYWTTWEGRARTLRLAKQVTRATGWVMRRVLCEAMGLYRLAHIYITICNLKRECLDKLDLDSLVSVHFSVYFYLTSVCFK